jgi:hypothetical protein
MQLRKRLDKVLVAGVVTFALVIATVAFSQAVVQKDFFTGGPVFTPLGTGTITNSNYVQLPSGGWQITVHGVLNDLDNAPDRAERWTHETLATFCFQPGDSFNLRVTPSGNISLTCSGD